MSVFTVCQEKDILEYFFNNQQFIGYKLDQT